MAAERKLDEWAADYVAGNFSADEAETFAQLMAEHPELQTEVDRLENTLGLMLNELPMEEPPPSLRDLILAEMEAPELAGSEVKVQRQTSSGIGRNPSPLPWLWAAAAAGAAVLSLLLGFHNHRLRLANQQLQQQLLAATPAQQAQLILQQPATRFYDFVGTENAADAFGSMIVDTDGLRAAIAFNNLEPLAENQTYALWVSYQGQYIPCGSFQTDTGGTTFATLPMPPVYQSRPWVKDVIVTIESADLPAQPTGPVVAKTV